MANRIHAWRLVTMIEVSSQIRISAVKVMYAILIYIYTYIFDRYAFVLATRVHLISEKRSIIVKHGSSTHYHGNPCGRWLRR